MTLEKEKLSVPVVPNKALDKAFSTERKIEISLGVYNGYHMLFSYEWLLKYPSNQQYSHITEVATGGVL